MNNPYAPPSDNVNASGSPTTGLRLYSAGQIAWATILGSLIAGSTLLALNYRRLGHASTARFTWVTGFVLTVALIVAALMLPDNIPSSIFTIGPTLGIYYCAKSLQDNKIDHMFTSGQAQRESTWTATGIAILCTIVLGVLLLGAMLAIPEDWFVAIGV